MSGPEMIMCPPGMYSVLKQEIEILRQAAGGLRSKTVSPLDREMDLD